MDLMNFSQEKAQQLDQQDPLAHYRNQFFLPEKEGKKLVYFIGNSLGLQPKKTRQYIEQELLKWEQLAGKAHFEGNPRWYDYRKSLKPALQMLLGASEKEVAPMNQLTVNLHLLLATFYRPTAQKYKIVMEAGAFPSDQYAIESQVRGYGYDPEEAIVELQPREGEHCLRNEDIIKVLNQHTDQVAVVLLGAVQYYTGQWFDMPAIAKAAHQIGAFIGYDLAHAIGNVPMQMHDWEVDFATWCAYKYLNGSPGGVSGIYIHEKYATDTQLHRWAGWWGYDEASRFEMKKGFKPMQSAEGWQLSNEPILAMAAQRASLDLFAEVGMDALRKKSILLTQALEKTVHAVAEKTQYPLTIITPTDIMQRGAQISIAVPTQGKAIHEAITQRGVVADWRNPDVIRVAPVPFYNTFEEVWLFGELLKESIQTLKS